MKYVIPVSRTSEQITELFAEMPMRSGFYNWAKVMDGQIGIYSKLDLEDFDVIHFNGAPSDWGIILDAKNKLKNSSTKIVVNNDYVAEFWHKWKQDPLIYEQVQECGDIVFGTEPYQTSQMIDRAICIPHPTNTKEMKMLNNKTERDKRIGFICHHYDRSALQRSLLSMKLKKDLDCETVLYNYVKGDGNDHKMSQAHFDTIKQQMSFPQFCMSLMRNKMLLELSDYHTYGRCTVETAALNVPVVGSDRIFSLKHNYPNTCCDPYDHTKIRELCKKLMTNDKFWQNTVDYAYNACEHFNYKNSKDRMMKALDGVRK